jgi:hypothetical protein
LSFIVVSPLSIFLQDYPVPGVGPDPDCADLSSFPSRTLMASILTTSSAEGTASRDSIADHSSSAGGSVPVSGIVTSTTLEGDESPEAFHA